MYFLLASIVGLIGIIILLRLTKPRVRDIRHLPHIIDTHAWIESWEFSFQRFLRKILRIMVVHIVQWYRFIIYDMHIHTTVKKKVRELLHEHYHEKRNKK